MKAGMTQAAAGKDISSDDTDYSFRFIKMPAENL